MSSDPFRVVFLGNDVWSVPSLIALAASRHRVDLVVTRVPRPGRRGAGPVPTPVAIEAGRLDLRLAEVETLRSGAGLDAVAAAAPDVLVVVAYGEVLRPAVLEIPRVAPVNVHFSLLPALRGASPVQTALARGLDETGVTTMVMNEGLDTGDVLLRRPVPIEHDDDAGSLGDRLARVGGDALVRTLDLLADGTARPTPQDEAAATYAPKLRPENRRLDWTRPAMALANVVRAMAPDPGATSTFRGAPVKVLRAHAVVASGAPGEIVDVDRAGVTVAAGESALKILEVAPSGRARMTAAAFANGFRPRVGERWS